MFGRLITALLVIAGSAVFALGTPGTAFACGCAVPMSMQKTSAVFESVAGSGAVFLGTPTSKTTGSDAQGYIVDFDVAGVLDGQVQAITTVSTATETTACGAGFTVGTEYLVVASSQNTNGATWSAASCGGTSLASDRVSVESAVSVFGQPRPIIEPPPLEVVAAEQSPDHTNYVPWVVGLIAAAAAAALAVLLRRSSANRSP
ncbi:hypothetical protein BH93_00585 [Rhodococcoides fascians A25f]|uniref:hypothetical protein n=1 Tax=Rhodococcoides fascians TaxID=1828 RepID=UPI00055C1B6B|nr:hypothetical protein [Rhodococcus fascians]QII04063.1 hypothetical protein BH93_00585 [Rhodococcus fascians A25f]